MDHAKLYEILAATTVQLRKGPVFTGTPELVAQAEAGGDEPLTGGGVLEVWAMPRAEDRPELTPIDVHFMVVGVDPVAAEEHRAALIEQLDSWPSDELAGGPSFLAVGATVGDQGAAFQLFALGAALGLWGVITPKTFGLEGDAAERAAGNGGVWMSGYRPRPA